MMGSYMMGMVARGGIEPPTRGFSEPVDGDHSESIGVNSAKKATIAAR